MVQLEMSQTFPVAVLVAFAHVTDLRNWKLYWHAIVAMSNAADARWKAPRGQLR
jgi:hypothetical protein